MQTKSLLALPRILTCCFLFFMLYSCNSTCSKTVSCPAYSSPLADSWFPYNDQQQLVFKSSGGLYDTLHLQLQDSTAAYTHTTGGSTPSSGCSASKSLESIERDSLNNNKLRIEFMILGAAYSTLTGTSVSIYLGAPSYFEGRELTDTGFLYYSVSNTGYYINNRTPQTLHNYLIGGTTYPLAQVFINDTAIVNNAVGTYKIIVAKNAGVIEYETNPGNIVWIKQ
jgi:hypothetical protein